MITTEMLQRLETLAATARPISDDDWGSTRHNVALNAFMLAFDRAGLLTDGFEHWCLKATTEEMLDEAMRIARNTAPASSCPHLTFTIAVSTADSRKVWTEWTNAQRAWQSAWDHARGLERIGKTITGISITAEG